MSNLLEIFASLNGETPEQVAGHYTRYGELKNDLAALVIEVLAPMQRRHDELLASPEELHRMASRGAEKAAAVAGVMYRRAAAAMGLA